ncbi:hypothetical protein QTG54_007966, partial [Skeletonema marinoi]
MIEPTSGDILLGRGVRINNHPGNEAYSYREIISENAATYAASTKSDKTNLSTNIFTQLLNSNPPRRFLEKSETGKWQEVPLKRAVTKISQALRDVARDRAKAAGAVAASSTVSSFQQTTINNVSNNNESELAFSSSTPAAAAMPSYLPAPNLYTVAEFTATETMINSS